MNPNSNMIPQLNLTEAARRLNWQPETLLEAAAQGKITPLVHFQFFDYFAAEISSALLEENKEIKTEDARWMIHVPFSDFNDRFRLRKPVYQALLDGADTLAIHVAIIVKNHYLPEPKQDFEWVAFFEQPTKFCRDQIFFKISDLDYLKDSKK